MFSTMHHLPHVPHVPHILALLALGASAILVVTLRGGIAAVAALVVSLVEVLRDFGILHLDVRGVPLELSLGLALAVAGVFLYFKAAAKIAVAAATCVTLVGVLSVLGHLYLGSA